MLVLKKMTGKSEALQFLGAQGKVGAASLAVMPHIPTFSLNNNSHYFDL